MVKVIYCMKDSLIVQLSRMSHAILIVQLSKMACGITSTVAFLGVVKSMDCTIQGGGCNLFCFNLSLEFKFHKIM